MIDSLMADPLFPALVMGWSVIVVVGGIGLFAVVVGRRADRRGR